jgi:hypothetical protein
MVTRGHTGVTKSHKVTVYIQGLRSNASRNETVTSASEKRWSRHRIDLYSCVCVFLQRDISSERRPCSSKNRTSALASYRCVLVTSSPTNEMFLSAEGLARVKWYTLYTLNICIIRHSSYYYIFTVILCREFRRRPRVFINVNTCMLLTLIIILFFTLKSSLISPHYHH